MMIFLDFALALCFIVSVISYDSTTAFVTYPHFNSVFTLPTPTNTNRQQGSHQNAQYFPDRSKIQREAKILALSGCSLDLETTVHFYSYLESLISLWDSHTLTATDGRYDHYHNAQLCPDRRQTQREK
jgi:hypothetical protein